MLALLIACAAFFAVPTTARAQDLAIVRVSDVGGGEPLRRGPVQARVGEAVTLRVVSVGRGGRLSPVPPGSALRWFRVVPRMQHTSTPPPNEGVDQYSNSVLFGPRHGQWIGYDGVEYEMVELDQEGEQLVVANAGPIGGSRGNAAEDHARFGGAGSSWYAATVRFPDGTVHRTPDAHDGDHLGLSRAVMRVSFRTDDGYLGWLSTYFRVPNVFGSTGPQADRYVGADCADVLVGAHRASGARRARYTSVGGISSVARPVTSVLFLGDAGQVRDEHGATVALRWGEAIEAGDLFAIDYSAAGAQLPRPWDHIGALLGDATGDADGDTDGDGVLGDTDGDGVLGGEDMLRHMTPAGLLDRALAAEGPIRFRVWRLRE